MQEIFSPYRIKSLRGWIKEVRSQIEKAGEFVRIWIFLQVGYRKKERSTRL